MQDTHRVILTAVALADLENIAHFIHQDSPQNAATVAELILDAVDSLAFMPSRFRRVGKSRKRGTPILAMVVRPFIIYYRVDDPTLAVFILNIRHGSRRQPNRFA